MKNANRRKYMSVIKTASILLYIWITFLKEQVGCSKHVGQLTPESSLDQDHLRSFSLFVHSQTDSSPSPTCLLVPKDLRCMFWNCAAGEYVSIPCWHCVTFRNINLLAFLHGEDLVNPEQISKSIYRNAAQNLKGTSAVFHCCLQTFIVVLLSSALSIKLPFSAARYFTFWFYSPVPVCLLLNCLALSLHRRYGFLGRKSPTKDYIWPDISGQWMCSVLQRRI